MHRPNVTLLLIDIVFLIRCLPNPILLYTTSTEYYVRSNYSVRRPPYLPVHAERQRGAGIENTWCLYLCGVRIIQSFAGFAASISIALLTVITRLKDSEGRLRMVLPRLEEDVRYKDVRSVSVRRASWRLFGLPSKPGALLRRLTSWHGSI